MHQPSFSVKKRFLIGHAALLCGLMWQTPAWCQLQAGRMADGTLVLTDGSLPVGVKPSGLALDQAMTLPTTTNEPAASPKRPPPADNPPTSASTKSAEEKTTCRGIQHRLRETKAELDMVERKKAAGTLLIPNSGLVTLRQNIATLERLQDLCD